MPNSYLLKTEPSTYSFTELLREKTTTWDGITNPAAVKNLREMRPGDRLVIYHSGKEKNTVGSATVVTVDASDPKKPRLTIKAGKAFAQQRSLAEIKGDPRFKTSPLVRQTRLSVVPLTAEQYSFVASGK